MVTAVRPLDDFELEVSFENGEQRRFDVKPYLDRGIFMKLTEPEVFRSVRVVAGSIEWPRGVDLSGDTVFLEGVPIGKRIGNGAWNRAVMNLLYRLLRVLAAIWLLLPAVISLASAYMAIDQWWDPGESPFMTKAELHASLASSAIFAVVALLLLVLGVLHHASWRGGDRSVWRRAAVLSAPVCVMSPVICRALLPWEDPYTGMGSPAAVLVNLVVYTPFYGAVFGIPAWWLLRNAWKSAWR